MPSFRCAAGSAEFGASRDHLNRYTVVSFYDLVGEAEDQWRDRKAERVCGLEVDDKLEFGRLINRDVARLGAVEDIMHVIRDTASKLGWRSHTPSAHPAQRNCGGDRLSARGSSQQIQQSTQRGREGRLCRLR